jgi:hypothetical protein
LDGPNSRLGLDDAAILVDEQTACALAPNTMKILWVVNSENYIYKRNSLNRAKKVGVFQERDVPLPPPPKVRCTGPVLRFRIRDPVPF